MARFPNLEDYDDSNLDDENLDDVEENEAVDGIPIMDLNPGWEWETACDPADLVNRQFPPDFPKRKRRSGQW